MRLSHLSSGGALPFSIPPDFALPVLITQHLPDSFMPYFAAQIALLAGRPCAVATEHMRITPGRVILAPGDAHIRVVRLGGGAAIRLDRQRVPRSEEHTSELQSLMRISYAVFCLKKKK